MPSNKKRRIRERREKTGESYSTARKHLGAAIEPVLVPTGTMWLDREGRVVPNDGTHPQAEILNVMDFDGVDLKKAWVPETAFDDPSMPKRPGMRAGTKRVLSLAEYIRLRERKTGSNPVLFKINMDAGHAGASGRFSRLEEIAFTYAFALKVTGKAAA